MKKLLVVFGFLLVTFACQKDDQIAPQPADDSKPGTSDLKTSKNKQSSSRVGGHPYWYFYRGQSTTNLRSAYSDDGETWQGDYMFDNNIGSTTSPAPVIFNSKFYCIYKGGGSNNIYFSSSSNGINWQPNTQIPSITSLHAPTAVVLGGYIYVFYVRVSSNTICYVSSGDGVTWTFPRTIDPFRTGDTCDGAVNAFVNPDNKIVLYYSSASELRYRTANSATSGDVDFPAGFSREYAENGEIIKTTTGVSVVYKDYYLDSPLWQLVSGRFVAYKSPNGGRLNIYRTYDTQRGKVFWTNAYTSNNPSMVYFNGKFTIVYKSLSSGAILQGHSWHGEEWWSNDAAIGQTANGGPRMIVE